MVYDLLLKLDLASGLLVFVPLVLIIGISIYLISANLIQPKLQKGQERVGRVLFRVGASLLALILSVTFANQRVDYFKLKNSMEEEAAKLVDIHMELDFFNDPSAGEIQSEIREYIIDITENSWISPHGDALDSIPFRRFREIYWGIVNLQVDSPIHKTIQENMISDCNMVLDRLQIRYYSSPQESNPLLYSTFFGLAAIMLIFGVYPPNRITILFLTLYVAFIGIVLYFIIVMSNPLEGPLQLKGEPFLMLKETIEKSHM